MAETCSECPAPAVWMYGPDGTPYCAEHVSRGCSCNIDEDGTEHFDTDGRRLPCVDYLFLSDHSGSDHAAGSGSSSSSGE